METSRVNLRDRAPFQLSCGRTRYTQTGLRSCVSACKFRVGTRSSAVLLKAARTTVAGGLQLVHLGGQEELQVDGWQASYAPVPLRLALPPTNLPFGTVHQLRVQQHSLCINSLRAVAL